MPQPKSICCNAEVIEVGGVSDFGGKYYDRGQTYHYECSVCKKSCDIKYKDSPARSGRKIKITKMKKLQKIKNLYKKVNKRKLDKLWQQCIHERDEVCQVCLFTLGLNAHHIFSRSRMNTRWDLDNGILLCSGCHVFNNLLSAHKAPRAFFQWLENRKGKQWLDRLEQRSNMVAKGIDLKLIEIDLTQKLKEYASNSL